MNSQGHKTQLTRMILIRSGKFAFADFDCESPIHLSGGNRNGKTTLINAIQLAICYDLKECSWGGHSIEATKKHHFGQGAYILFEFNTVVGPHCLLIRGLGALDKWDTEYEHWHGALDVDRFMNFHLNGDPSSPKTWDEIQKFLIEEQSKQITNKKEFDDFLFEDIGLLKRKRKQDLQAFRKLFKDILGFSSIEDERLKELFVGMWTSPKNRTINLTDKQDTLNQLITESEKLSYFDGSRIEIKQLLSDYEVFCGTRLGVSESLAKLNNSRKKYNKHLLDINHLNDLEDKKLTVDNEQIEKVVIELVGLERSELKVQGRLEGEIQKINAELNYISKIDPNIRIQIHEFTSERDVIKDAQLAIQHANQGDGDSIGIRIQRNNMMIMRISSELEGDFSLKRLLIEKGFNENDLSKAAVLFNSDLLSVIPTGELSELTQRALTNLVDRINANKKIDFNGLELDVSNIAQREIEPLEQISELENRLEKLIAKKGKLIKEKELIDKWEDTKELLRKLDNSIKLGLDDIKKLDSEEQTVKSLKELEKELQTIEISMDARTKNIKEQNLQKSTNENTITTLRDEINSNRTKLEEIDRKFLEIEMYDFIQQTESKQEINSEHFVQALNETIAESSRLYREKQKLDERNKSIFHSINRINYMTDIDEGIDYLRSEDEQFENKKQIQEADVRAFFAALTDNLQRFMECIQKIKTEVNKINKRLAVINISELDSVEIDVDFNDPELINLINSILGENSPQKTLFQESKADTERLESLMKKGEISLSKILKLQFKVDDGVEVIDYPNLKIIESNGTTLSIKVAIYSEIIGEMLIDGASIPIFIDEVGDLDDENFYTIIQYIKKRNLTPITATPKVTWVIPDFYHLVGKGNDKILDDKNRSSWKRKGVEHESEA